jgi:hypothetical protein
MTELDDLARQVAEIRTTLGMEHQPPLDRLSLIDLKIETVRSLVQQLGLSLGDQQRLLVTLEARQLEQGRALDALVTDVGELKAGQGEMIRLLTQLLDREEDTQ